MNTKFSNILIFGSTTFIGKKVVENLFEGQALIDKSIPSIDLKQKIHDSDSISTSSSKLDSKGTQIECTDICNGVNEITLQTSEESQEIIEAPQSQCSTHGEDEDCFSKFKNSIFLGDLSLGELKLFANKLKIDETERLIANDLSNQKHLKKFADDLERFNIRTIVNCYSASAIVPSSSPSTQNNNDNSIDQSNGNDNILSHPTIVQTLIDFCITYRIHYLDATSSIGVIERARQLGSAAAKAGILLMPGCGIHSVAIDCAASKLTQYFSQNLNNLQPNHLQIGIYSLKDAVTNGSLLLDSEEEGEPNLLHCDQNGNASSDSSTSASSLKILRNGSLVEFDLINNGEKMYCEATKQILFRASPSYYHSVDITSTLATLPCLLSTFETTQIGNIDTFIGTPGFASVLSKFNGFWPIKYVFGTTKLRNLALKQTQSRTLPTDKELEQGQTFIYVSAHSNLNSNISPNDDSNSNSKFAEIRVETREPHMFSIVCLSEIIRRLLICSFENEKLNQDVQNLFNLKADFKGFQTPASLFGSDFLFLNKHIFFTKYEISSNFAQSQRSNKEDNAYKAALYCGDKINLNHDSSSFLDKILL